MKESWTNLSNQNLKHNNKHFVENLKSVYR